MDYFDRQDICLSDPALETLCPEGSFLSPLYPGRLAGQTADCFLVYGKGSDGTLDITQAVTAVCGEEEVLQQAHEALSITIPDKAPDLDPEMVDAYTELYPQVCAFAFNEAPLTPDQQQALRAWLQACEKAIAPAVLQTLREAFPALHRWVETVLPAADGQPAPA